MFQNGHVNHFWLSKKCTICGIDLTTWQPGDPAPDYEEPKSLRERFGLKKPDKND